MTVEGYDLDEASITAARAEAEAAGVADRVRFEVREAAGDAIDGAYHLVFCVEMLHDVPDPVGVLATMRRLRAPGGTVLVMDERAAETFGVGVRATLLEETAREPQPTRTDRRSRVDAR